jgi:ABC-type cobalamin/Fe3+-siderophores transport systems, ATPase components
MEPLLELRGVSIGYDNRPVYQNIDISAAEGEMVALVGANGMGKSTLLKSIASLIKHSSGDIIIDSKPIEKYRPRDLAGMVSFVPSQSPRTKQLSLFDMVAVSLYNNSNWIGNISDEQRGYISAILDKVGLCGFEERDSSTLSDGEFHRASIARSLVQNSKIIVLDEPTAFLDISNKITVVRLLKQIASDEKKSVIFSTHDLQQAIKMCDKIWIMGHNGFTGGTPESLIEKGAFETMFKDSSLKFDSNLYTLV